MSKTTKSVVIAASVLLVLGIVLVVLTLTAPKEEQNSSSIPVSSVSEKVVLTDKETDKVLSFTVTNKDGKYTFERQKRVVSSTSEDGTVVSTDEYYWTSADLKGIPQSDSAVRSFAGYLAGLTAQSTVEEDVADLEKYGLADPSATAEVSFEDGTSVKLLLGIQNPANTSTVYCRLDGSNTVLLVSYYSVSDAYDSVRRFANLALTAEYKTDGSNELDYLKIERKDLDEAIELRYMFDIAEKSENDETGVISTFNTHRFVSPVIAEIDTTKGKTVCYGVYGLNMNACEYLEQTEENMKACGLDDPFAQITFKYGGSVNRLLLGNEIVSTVETDSSSAPALTEVTGYYAVMDGVPGIYSISKDSAPWYTLNPANIISKRPVSPYIYAAEYVEITTPDGVFKFDIDAENKKFFCDGKELDGTNFRTFYQQLISSIGEEMYLEQTDAAPYVTVRFRYLNDYWETYGTEEDVLEFLPSDGRKCVIRLNGTTIFKIREIYVTRLIENIDALLNGGTVNLDW